MKQSYLRFLSQRKFPSASSSVTQPLAESLLDPGSTPTPETELGMLLQAPFGNGGSRLTGFPEPVKRDFQQRLMLLASCFQTGVVLLLRGQLTRSGDIFACQSWEERGYLSPGGCRLRRPPGILQVTGTLRQPPPRPALNTKDLSSSTW